MRAVCLLFVFAGCAAPRAATIPAVAPPPLPPKLAEEAATAIPLSALGAGGQNADWVDLEMPDDARVLTMTQEVQGGRETWMLALAGARRVLRVTLDDGKRTTHVAYAGKATKDGIAFRLVEQSGQVRFSAEHMTATCKPELVCSGAKPSYRVNALHCTFARAADESTIDEVWLAGGRGVDFVVSTCAQTRQREQMMYHRPTRPMGPPDGF